MFTKEQRRTLESTWVRRLPVRALQFASRELALDYALLRARGITDRSIATLLEQSGIDVTGTVRGAMQDAFIDQAVDPAVSPDDAFHEADPQFRGEGNPFVAPVFALVRRVFRDVLSPADQQ